MRGRKKTTELIIPTAVTLWNSISHQKWHYIHWCEPLFGVVSAGRVIFLFLYPGLAGQSKTRMYYHVSFFRHFNIGTETQIFRLYRERCCNSLKGWDFLKKNPSPITLVFIWTSSTCIPALMGRFCLRAQYKWRQALVTSLFVQHEKGWFLVKKKQCTSVNFSTQMHHVKCARLCLIGAFFFLSIFVFKPAIPSSFISIDWI